MANQGLFLYGHVKVADLQNCFWTRCLLRIVIGFLPVATKLLLPKQFQESCVVIQGMCQMYLLNSNCNHFAHIVTDIFPRKRWSESCFSYVTLYCVQSATIWKLPRQCGRWHFPEGQKKKNQLHSLSAFGTWETEQHWLDTVKFWICLPFFPWQVSFECVPFSYNSFSASWWMQRK